MYVNCYYNFENNKIYIFEENDKIIEKNYSPYCYVKTTEESEYKTIFGDNVKKEKLTKELKENKDAFETDINPQLRYLLNLYYDKDKIPVNKILYIDIETSSIGGFPDMKLADKEITAITCLYNNIYYVFILDNGNFSSKSKEDERFIICKSEKELLTKFILFYQKIKPTIISGWHSFAFDIPYLYRRMINIIGKIYADKLSPIDIVKEGVINFKNQIYEGYKIAGVSHLDYMILYKKHCINDRTSYSLNYIANLEVGEGKTEFKGNLDDLRKNDINKYIEYNINDVRLLSKLEGKLHYLEISIAFCHKGCITYEEIFMQSRIIEGAILKYLKQNNLVGINKPQYDYGNTDKFEGAYVTDVEPGLYKDILSYDVSSLYPNLIRTINISNETKLGKVVNWQENLEEYKIQLINNKILNLNKEQFNKLIIDKKLTISSHGILYKTNKQGILPKIIESWFNERLEFRKLAMQYEKEENEKLYKEYDIKQYVLKILMNSLYGAISLSSFRFYDLDNALSITLSGQKIIKESAKFIEEKYKNTHIYSDTDSLYFHIDNFMNNYEKNKLDQLKLYSNEILTLLNSKLKEFSKQFFNSDNNYLKFSHEIKAKTGIWLSKKHYALIMIEKNGFEKHDDIYVKGIDVEKSNFPSAMKTILKQVMIDILNEKSEEEIKKNLIEFKNNLEKNSIEDIAIPTGVNHIEKYVKNNIIQKGAPINVKSAVNYNLLIQRYNLNNKYRPIASGEKIKYIYLKKNEFDMETLAFKDDSIPDEFINFYKKYIDYDKIFQSILVNKVQSFYDAMKWGKLNLIENKLKKFI